MLKKLAQNKLALIGLIVICVLCLVAFLGYFITPDSSNNANTINLELALQKPGFEVEMIKLNAKEEQKVGLVQFFLFGSNAENTWIPVQSHSYPDSYIKYSKNGVGQVIEFEDYNGLSKEEWYENNVKMKKYFLGTDRYGRDVLSRLIIGARVSLLVGFISVLITLLIGTSLGLLSGYFGGWVDRTIMWLINVVWSLPTLLIAISISFAFNEKGLYQVFLAIGLSMWVELARIVRGQVLQIKEMEYIQAAKVLGFKSLRIIFKHILPNITAPIIVVCAANFASAILLEAGLSFLGLGVQPPTPSWGSMIKEHYSYIVFDAAHLAIIPGLCIMILVMSFNFLGNGLRDALDVNLKN